jgi:hypothetical protein
MFKTQKSLKPARLSRRRSGYNPRETKIPSSLSSDIVTDAVASLQNTRILKTSSDSKSPLVEYDMKVVGVLRGLMRDRPYTSRLSRVSTITSGTGVLALNIATDLTTYSEGAALTALFDEVRLVSSHFRAVLNNDGGQQFSFMLGYDATVVTGAPTPAIIARLPVSKIFSTFNRLTDAAYELNFHGPKPLWGLTIQEGQSTDPQIRNGMDGTWQIAAETVPATAIVYFAYTLTAIAQFRLRV